MGYEHILFVFNMQNDYLNHKTEKIIPNIIYKIKKYMSKNQKIVLIKNWFPKDYTIYNENNNIIPEIEAVLANYPNVYRIESITGHIKHLQPFLEDILHPHFIEDAYIECIGIYSDQEILRTSLEIKGICPQTRIKICHNCVLPFCASTKSLVQVYRTNNIKYNL